VQLKKKTRSEHKTEQTDGEVGVGERLRGLKRVKRKDQLIWKTKSMGVAPRNKSLKGGGFGHPSLWEVGVRPEWRTFPPLVETLSI